MDRQYIEDTEFSPARRGYEPSEVRLHLRRLADHVEQVERERDSAISEKESALAFLAHEAGEEVRRIVQAAGEGGTRLRARADQAAERVRAEAEGDATALLENAERHAAEHIEAADAAARRLMNEIRGFLAQVVRYGDAWRGAALTVENLEARLSPLRSSLSSLESGLTGRGAVELPPMRRDGTPSTDEAKSWNGGPGAVANGGRIGPPPR